MSILQNISFEGTRSVLSIGHRAVLYMLAQRGPTAMHLAETVVGKLARKGIEELSRWGTITLTPILGRDEYYELKLTDLGRQVVSDIERRVHGQED